MKSTIGSLAVALLMAISPGAALAYSSQFMSGQHLSAGNAFADYNAHAWVSEVETYSDHTVCPAVASGYGGYTSTPFTGGHSTAYYSDDCGYGTSWGLYNAVPDYLHGAAYNKNLSTLDYINYAYVFYG